MFPLRRDACRRLRDRALLPAAWDLKAQQSGRSAQELRSIYQHFAELSDYRRALGRKHGIASVLCVILPVHRALADRVTLGRKTIRQMRGAVACPAQWALRITTRHRLKMTLQRHHKVRVQLRHTLAPATGPTQTPRWRLAGSLGNHAGRKLLQASPNSAARHARRLGHPCNASTPDGARFRRRPQAPGAFVKNRAQPRKFGP